MLIIHSSSSPLHTATATALSLPPFCSYSLYPSSYYRFRQAEGQDERHAAASHLARFSEKKADLSEGAEAAAAQQARKDALWRHAAAEAADAAMGDHPAMLSYLQEQLGAQQQQEAMTSGAFYAPAHWSSFASAGGELERRAADMLASERSQGSQEHQWWFAAPSPSPSSSPSPSPAPIVEQEKKHKAEIKSYLDPLFTAKADVIDNSARRGALNHNLPRFATSSPEEAVDQQQQRQGAEALVELPSAYSSAQRKHVQAQQQGQAQQSEGAAVQQQAAIPSSFELEQDGLPEGPSEADMRFAAKVQALVASNGSK